MSAGHHERVFARNSPKATRNADSSSCVGQRGILTGSSSRLSLSSASTDFCRLPYFVNLVSSLPWTLLLIDTFCFSFRPSFPRPHSVSCEISCASSLCGFHAQTDKRILCLTSTPIEMNATNRVRFLVHFFLSFLSLQYFSSYFSYFPSFSTRLSFFFIYFFNSNNFLWNYSVKKNAWMIYWYFPNFIW